MGRECASPSQWLGPELAAEIAAGDADALVRAVACVAKVCIERGGGAPAYRPAMLDAACDLRRPPEQRVLLAVGCDLLDLIAHAPQGRRILLDLGLDQAQ